MRSVEVMIIGGGASGMVAAIMAARQGARAMILEKKNRLGKKLLATGNGKCNFTNDRQEAKCYRSENSAYPFKVIQKFGAEEVIKWFDEIGILARHRDGYVYPASNQATSVLHALEREAERLKIEVHLEEIVQDVSKHISRKSGEADGYRIITDKGEYLSRKVILSTGGKAAFIHGSTGDGYGFAKAFGHHIVNPVPALTSLVLEGNFMKSWSGVRVQGHVTLYSQTHKILAEDTGEIQMVAYGISGIPVFQLSRFAAREIAQEKKPYLVLDSMPDYTKEWILKELVRRIARNPEQSMGDLLEGMLPDKLASVFLKQAGFLVADHVKKVNDTKLKCIVEKIKEMKLQIKAVSDFEKAQVTAGGVCTEEINPETMESFLAPNLYITGELADVDGICGGYNLQWAWVTGYLAGKACGPKK